MKHPIELIREAVRATKKYGKDSPEARQANAAVTQAQAECSHPVGHGRLLFIHAELRYEGAPARPGDWIMWCGYCSKSLQHVRRPRSHR